MPQCGYSGTVVNILQSLSVPFETVDVMADDRIRQGIKVDNGRGTSLLLVRLMLDERVVRLTRVSCKPIG